MMARHWDVEYVFVVVSIHGRYSCTTHLVAHPVAQSAQLSTLVHLAFFVEEWESCASILFLPHSCSLLQTWPSFLQIPKRKSIRLLSILEDSAKEPSAKSSLLRMARQEKRFVHSGSVVGCMLESNRFGQTEVEIVVDLPISARHTSLFL